MDELGALTADRSALTAARRRLYALVAALVIDVAVAIIVGIDDLGRFLRGQHDVGTTIALIAIVWSVGVAAAATVLARSLFQARRTLHRQRQAMAADAATSVDWLWETDTHHVFTYSSNGVQDLLGYTPQEIVGTSALQHLLPDQVDRARALMEAAMTSRTGWGGVELRWRRRDGSEITLQGTAAPIVDMRGRITGFRGTRRQVTEAMTSERALIALKHRVADLLEDDAGLSIALQPIVSLTSGRMVGAEALARFRDGRSPDLWLQDARICGQQLALDQLTVLRATELITQLPQDSYLSINATPELLTHTDLLRSLAQSSLPFDRLVIEVTEHVEISSYPDLLASLAEIRERGVRLAVDDTGAGYASFKHVLQLRPDIIKIDRSLVSRVSTDAARRSLITALVLLALDLGASITAEGVEHRAELETLATLGVDCAQGYLLARPTTDRGRWRRWSSRDWQHLLATTPADPPPAYPVDDVDVDVAHREL